MPAVIDRPSKGEQDENAHHAVHVEGGLQIGERLAEAVFGGDQFGTDDAEQRKMRPSRRPER